MNAALIAQRERRLDRAADLYRQVLERLPTQPDALHMLGVISLEKGQRGEALKLILRALDLTLWKYPAYRHNLGLALALGNSDEDNAMLLRSRERYRQWRASHCTTSPTTTRPRISVVIPCYNHGCFIGNALRSVYAQSYRNVEVVVIDDGSDDGSAEIARDALADSPFPNRLIARENRGAAATINEGIAMSTGEYVNVLNSDDEFSPERLQTMLDALSPGQGAWGFSAVSLLDAEGRAIDVLKDARAFALSCSTRSIPFRETIGFALLTENVAVSTGNIFATRAFIDRVGGFREFRFNHDWDFCLRALRIEEPIFVERETYRYRLHDANTINESGGRARAEANRVLEDYCGWAFDAASNTSPFAPCVGTWGSAFTATMLGSGMAEVIGPSHLRRLAVEALEAMAAATMNDSSPT